MKKTSIILIGYMIISCVLAFVQGCSDGCDTTYYEVQKIDASAFKLLTQVDTLVDPARKFLVLDSAGNTAIPFDSLVIQLKTSEYPTIAYRHQFFNEAFAFFLSRCDQSIGAIPPKQISITSSKKYNDDFPQGSNLISILSFRYNLGSDPQDMTVFQTSIGFGTYLLFFNQPPSHDDVHTITIEFTRADGSLITTTITDVHITK